MECAREAVDDRCTATDTSDLDKTGLPGPTLSKAERPIRHVDILTLAAAIVIAGLAQIIAPFSISWWTGMGTAATLGLWAASKIVRGFAADATLRCDSGQRTSHDGCL